MNWTELNTDGFFGLEAFMSDGTAVDIVTYGDSMEFCWMIRVPIQDDYSTHEVYASYDDDRYFDNITDALDSCMEYLRYYFPALYRESEYSQNKKGFVVRFLQAAAAIGLVAVFSTSSLFGFAQPAFASEADYVHEARAAVYAQVEDDDPITILMDADSGAYYIEATPGTGDTDGPGGNMGDFLDDLDRDMSPYFQQSGVAFYGGSDVLYFVLDDGQSLNVSISELNEIFEQAGAPINEDFKTCRFEYYLCPGDVYDEVMDQYSQAARDAGYNFQRVNSSAEYENGDTRDATVACFAGAFAFAAIVAIWKGGSVIPVLIMSSDDED